MRSSGRLGPLEQVMTALDRTGAGAFGTRLPVFRIPELGRLARAFNGMADRLAQAVSDNVHLEAEREVSTRVQASLEAERRHIALELHDELAQGITAVRALAGAIVQHANATPAVRHPAEHIIVAAGQMQDGVHAILHRLRESPDTEPLRTEDSLRHHIDVWQQHHPGISLDATLDLGGPTLPGQMLTHTLLRAVQEGLTNVARHACATRVDLVLRRSHDGCWFELLLADNGKHSPGPSSAAGCGMGLTGMRERVRALGGELTFETIAGHGARLVVRIPAIPTPAGAGATPPEGPPS
ncbi:HAMP domain-containing sensor histidine kinase [Trinickia caryophylli]|uniref:HAMP domain-containing sensor histidine kinase n=1 Tax=Trinickia caryophylli TaxID=28094 RepID=UPI0030B87E06